LLFFQTLAYINFNQLIRFTNVFVCLRTFRYYLDPTRNLAIANRSRVNSKSKVTTVNFRGWGFHGQEAYKTPVVAAAALSINFRVG